MGPTGFDRRRHPRARTRDLAATLVAEDGRSVRCKVENLSAGGARLVVPATVRRCERVVVTLHAARDVELVAEVVASEPLDAGITVIGVEFYKVRDPARNAIEALVLRALDEQRASARRIVLVVDDDPEVRAALERQINRLGLAAVSVGTPLEAVYALHDPSLDIQIVVVDVMLGAENGLDVLAYLAGDHASVRRVVMSGAARDTLRREVAEGRAHAWLDKPWRPDELRAALGVT